MLSIGQTLYDAAQSDRLSEVLSLLKDGPDPDVNWRDVSSWTSPILLPFVATVKL